MSPNSSTSTHAGGSVGEAPGLARWTTAMGSTGWPHRSEVSSTWNTSPALASKITPLAWPRSGKRLENSQGGVTDTSPVGAAATTGSGVNAQGTGS